MTLDELIQEGESFKWAGDIISTVTKPLEYAKWQETALMFLQNYYPNHPQTIRFSEILNSAKRAATQRNSLVGVLQAFKICEPPQTENKDVLSILENIFENFQRVEQQLRRRYNNRETLRIKDEYDVQDLLHSLLKLHFDDVRPEEWAPSYAGGSKRMDFLLKKESIVIEVKKTRDNLKDKEIGEQLIIDIANYQNHPNCQVLLCFVYDPDCHISNPRGLENDLEKENENLKVKVYIRPQ